MVLKKQTSNPIIAHFNIPDIVCRSGAARLTAEELPFLGSTTVPIVINDFTSMTDTSSRPGSTIFQLRVSQKTTC